MGIFIIGAGVGDTKILTREAEEKIEKSDIIIGAKRVAEPFSESGKRVFFEYEAEKIAAILRENKYDNAAVLFSGDASFFSGAKKLIELFPTAEVTAGISCVSYFCAKIKKSVEDMNIVSLHGRKCNIASEVRGHKNTFALLGENPCAHLTEFGLGDTKIYIGERLSYPDEKISAGCARDFCGVKLSPLSVMIIENPNYENRVTIGINDDEFIRGSVPMTKSEVRAVSVAKLNIAEDDICWDIGSGTGSVTVETALLCPRGTVYAAEKNPEAAELTEKNCRKFQADNVTVIRGSAPECLGDTKTPDKVFIGGSSGRMREIIAAALSRNEDAVFVINAAAIETVSGTLKILKEFNLKYEISLISAARNREAGTLNLMSALNPVYVIKAWRERSGQ